MSKRRWSHSRFHEEAEPLGGLTNLLDLMLVFACGLIAALVVTSGGLTGHFQKIEKGKELPEVPQGVGKEGRGYEPVGQVFRHAETGQLVLVGDSSEG